MFKFSFTLELNQITSERNGNVYISFSFQLCEDWTSNLSFLGRNESENLFWSYKIPVFVGWTVWFGSFKENFDTRGLRKFWKFVNSKAVETIFYELRFSVLFQRLYKNLILCFLVYAGQSVFMLRACTFISWWR